MINHTLVGWAIDEDALANGGVRREGMFYACNGAVQHVSAVLISAALAMFGAYGLDGAKCPADQPQAARDAIFHTFAWGCTALVLLTAWVCLRFPIRGARLEKLRAAKAGLAAPTNGVDDEKSAGQYELAET